jgi:hypothetical protein
MTAAINQQARAMMTRQNPSARETETIKTNVVAVLKAIKKRPKTLK